MFSENTIDCNLNITMQYQNLSIFDESSSDIQNRNGTKSHCIDEKALRMMQKMGYKKGSGLGKTEQGITKSVNIQYQMGKRGFGLKLQSIEDTMQTWNFSKEEVLVKENVTWLKNEAFTKASFQEMVKWITEGQSTEDIKTEDNFCDKEVLHKVVDAKNIFEEMDIYELCQARARSNPFETIRSVFFMNRAALKIANIDAVTDFMFTNIDKNEHFKDQKGPFYFADVCAGPGGFTEYILWKKQWMFKGFGLTLKDENDFKVSESTCACPVTFQALYGKDNDGNVCSPDNILDFKEKVLHETENRGVHFMMSDGGFSVEGNENFQEILSKSIYICQCLVALEIVRSHGHFVTKLFDTFTPFSVGLLYLMYTCFEKVLLFKPNSSRPANAERYFVCSNLKRDSYYEEVKKYLWIIVKRLWDINGSNDIDILEIVPLHILKNHQDFYKYIVNTNNNLAIRQTLGLEKLATFCRNPTLVEFRQEELRKKCLLLWKIPDKSRTSLPQLSPTQFIDLVLDKPEILLVQPKYVDHIDAFSKMISNIEDWFYFPLYSCRKTNNCNFYVGLTGKVCRLQKGKWIKMKNMELSRGSLVYAEFIKEKCTSKTGKKDSSECVKYSLHILDALCLGKHNLINMTFPQRQELIKIYCKSVNKESQSFYVRIRPKPVDKLINITSNCLVSQSKDEGTYTKLPLLGYKSLSETFGVNSLLLLKTNSNQSFHLAYVLRVQIFIKNMEENDEDSVLLEDLISEVKQKT